MFLIRSLHTNHKPPQITNIMDSINSLLFYFLALLVTNCDINYDYFDSVRHNLRQSTRFPYHKQATPQRDDAIYTITIREPPHALNSIKKKYTQRITREVGAVEEKQLLNVFHAHTNIKIFCCYFLLLLLYHLHIGRQRQNRYLALTIFNLIH